MSQQEKPKEFWVNSETVSAWVGEAQSKKNYRFTGGIHVIEYSAYESQRAVIEKLEAEVNRLNELLWKYADLQKRTGE